MDPNKTDCVIKDENGKEIGRIAASNPRANDYITEISRGRNKVTVDYVERDGPALLAPLNLFRKPR